MDMAESNQTLLLMVLEYGDQVSSMISFCFSFLFLFVCLFVFFWKKSKQQAQFPLISHVRSYSFPIRDILSFPRSSMDSFSEQWLAIKPSLQTFFWLVTQSSPTNNVRGAGTRDEPTNVFVEGQQQLSVSRQHLSKHCVHTSSMCVVNISSTHCFNKSVYRGGCRSLSGTSVASPVVAGAVSLLLRQTSVLILQHLLACSEGQGFFWSDSTSGLNW